MTAQITWWAGANQIQDLSGSGLGFYGDDGFATNVRVGYHQGRTFITNSAGTTQGPEANNTKYLNAGSGILGQTGTGIALTAIPNYQCPLRIRFTNDTAVRVQNAELRAYDRTNPNNPPSGVTCKVAEIIHPDTVQNNNGSGDTTWYTPAGSSVVVPLANSPGPSGLYAGNGSNSNHSDTTHDWHVAWSSSPDNIGSKYFGAYISVEYL